MQKILKNIRLVIIALAITALSVLPAAAESSEPDPAVDQVALVNGKVITRAELDSELNQVQQQFARQGQTLSDDRLKEVTGQVLKSLIDQELLYQEAQKRGIEVPSEKAAEQFEKMQQALTDEQFAGVLAQMGLTRAALENRIERGLLIQELISTRIAPNIEVTRDEVKAYYDAHPEYFQQPEKVKARHILIMVDPQQDDTQKSQAKEKIAQIEQRLKAGEDFGELARETSEGPSAANGGDLGFFGRGQMVKPFEEVAFKLEPGKISDVVETRFGYHLIQVTDKQPAKEMGLEEVQSDLKAYLEREKTRVELKAYVENLRGMAAVETFI